MKETRIICDFCKKEEISIINHPMIFIRHFDDTDGKTFYNHLVSQNVDVCANCLDKITESEKFPVDERVQGYGYIIIQEATNEN